MDGLSRRRFLGGGAVAVVGAGLASAAPGFSSVLAPVEADIPAVDNSAVAVLPESAALPEGATLDTPLVAHVKDLATGEIGVYFGTNEVTFRDPQLAARLFRTAR